MKKEVKAQSVLQYLMISILALVIVISTTYLFSSYASESNVQIVESQINQMGRNIMDTAETVYFSGEFEG